MTDETTDTRPLLPFPGGMPEAFTFEGTLGYINAGNQIAYLFSEWNEGAIGPMEAFRGIAQLYRQHIALLAEQAAESEEAVKDMLKQIGDKMGEKHIPLPDWNVEYRKTEASTRRTVDWRKADEVLTVLRAMGETQLADQLADAFKETPVKGGASLGRMRKV